MKRIPINEKLVWDYDIPPNAQTNEAFREWYVKRVLTHGTASDIQAVGLDVIHYYFSHFHLPADIQEFWQWYFSQTAVKERYGHLDAISTGTA